MESTLTYRDVIGNPIPWPPPLDIRLANISVSNNACEIDNGDHLCLLTSAHDGEHQCYVCKGYWGK
jgi:hypothetical protein